MKNIVTIIVISLISLSFSADKPAYIIYDQEGNATDYSKMISELQKADIVFFGEQHNDPISHWMEIEVTKDLYEAKKENLILGAEMFEADVQLILNEYLNGTITSKKFEEEARVWPNHKTDYRPLVKFAASKKLYFIATNIPRRYAAIVSDKGFDPLEKLSDEAKKFIAPLPFEYDSTIKCYKSLLDTSGQLKDQMHGDLSKIAKAQATKDATMAHFIMKNWTKGKLFLHFNGSYHSDNFESILWYIKQTNKDIKIMTISCTDQPEISKLSDDNKNLANFIICVPESMTKTN